MAESATTINENGSSMAVGCAEASGPEVFDLTGACESEVEFDPGRALAQLTVASSWGESTQRRFTLSACHGSHVNGGAGRGRAASEMSRFGCT